MTMAIMAVLSAMIAVALAGAEESAKVSHTRALIARLHTLLMDRYESYRWRRLPIQSTGGENAAAAATTRCDAVRALMRMELPDRWSDIDPNNNDNSGPVAPTSTYLNYRAAYLAAGGPTDTTNQGADCLYWIVTMGLEENDVLENFSQADIGIDPTSPSAQAPLQCFIDAWGNPIQFIRWAPGFVSPLQPQNSMDRDQTDPTGVYGLPANDPARTGGAKLPVTFALYPLIYSAGPDGYYDIFSDTNPSSVRYSTVNNNPFSTFGGNPLIGTPQISTANTTGVLGSYDNITNQSIGSH